MIYFTPGPTQLHPAVQKGIHSALADGICSISHRSERFREIYRGAAAGIRALMQVPESHHILFVSSATEAMERIIQSCAGSRSFHFVNGAFSKRFFDISHMLRKNPERIDVQAGGGFSLQDTVIPEDIDLVCITQNETSTGVWIPPEDIARLKAKYPEKLFAVDIVSSAPCVELDPGAVDLAFFSVQKCFGMPAGLGVLIANGRSVETARALRTRGVQGESYHSILSLVELAAQAQTYETPNVLAIYLLKNVSEWMHQYGIGRIRGEMREKAEFIYGSLSTIPGAKAFVENEKFRSPTVIVADVQKSASDLRRVLASQGLQVGSGYSEFKEKQIRIANFPSHSMDDMRRLLAAIREVMQT